jgi:NUMOD1 domain
MAKAKLVKKKAKAQPASMDELFTQYNETGKWLNSFFSPGAAALFTGIPAHLIKKVLDGKALTAGKFYWAWGKARTLQVKLINQKRMPGYPTKNESPVSKYNRSGYKLAEYPSLAEAAKAVGVKTQSIDNVIKGNRKTTKGFYWQKGSGPEKIDLSAIKKDVARSTKNWPKKVQQYSLEGKLLHTYKSQSQAAKAVGVTATAINYACNGRGKTSKGFKWSID